MLKIIGNVKKIKDKITTPKGTLIQTIGVKIMGEDTWVFPQAHHYPEIVLEGIEIGDDVVIYFEIFGVEKNYENDDNTKKTFYHHNMIIKKINKI